jgi:hypothetical protein
MFPPPDGHHVGHQEALEVARYVTDMTTQLEIMAVAARLEVLAYFLRMARMEGDLLVAQPESSGDRKRIGPIDPEANNDKPF